MSNGLSRVASIGPYATSAAQYSTSGTDCCFPVTGHCASSQLT